MSKASRNTVTKCINFPDDLHDAVMLATANSERSFSWVVKNAVANYLKDEIEQIRVAKEF